MQECWGKLAIDGIIIKFTQPSPWVFPFLVYDAIDEIDGIIAFSILGM